MAVLTDAPEGPRRYRIQDFQTHRRTTALAAAKVLRRTQAARAAALADAFRTSREAIDATRAPVLASAPAASSAAATKSTTRRKRATVRS